MMNGGGGLSKLATALIVVLVISVVALFGKLLYSLWRRRQANNGGGGGADHLSSCPPSSDSTFSSKELLFFFCIRRHSSIDASSVTATGANDGLGSNRQLDVEGIDIDVLKLQGMFGPPRFLFTIKEEEREDLESPADKSLPRADKEAKKIGGESRNGRVMSGDCFQAVEEAAAVVVEIIDDDDGGVFDATPFSTPCGSPGYFTPTASPVHDVVRISSDSVTESFRRPEV